MEEKQKYNESLRANDVLKRQLFQNLENEKLKLSSLINETKDLMSMSYNYKIEKVKEDLINRMREFEKVLNIITIVKIIVFYDVCIRTNLKHATAEFQ